MGWSRFGREEAKGVVEVGRLVGFSLELLVYFSRCRLFFSWVVVFLRFLFLFFDGGFSSLC